ncbi:MAG TPA: CvpA family protein [Sedimentisphaerales bacterium]|nr:CvpA family protein [Sedimentisphaerales bacterium]
MAIGNLVVAALMLACAGYQYMKGNLVKGFTTAIITVCASIVAFAYFELLAGLLISRGERVAALIPWAYFISFTLLFVVAFAVLQTIAAQLMRQAVKLAPLPERIGRVACGLFLGLEMSGLLLAALAMTPLPNKYPYPRFNDANPNPDEPAIVLLNADGFAAGWFSTVSNGSLSGKTSFAALHPDFLDQAFLNRHKAADGVPLASSADAIELPSRRTDPNSAAAWNAPEQLNTTDGKPVPQKTAHNLVIVRTGFKRDAIKDAGKFTPCQLRLICKQRALADNPTAGAAVNAYPLGYIESQNRLKITRLSEEITVAYSHFEGQSSVRWIDFAFFVPNGFVPVFLEFKQNNIVEVPTLLFAEAAPPAVPFSQVTEPKKPSPPPSKKGAKSPKTKYKR